MINGVFGVPYYCQSQCIISCRRWPNCRPPTSSPQNFNLNPPQPSFNHHQIHQHQRQHPNTTMPSIETRPHPTKHRALHATSAFKPSQIIHTFHPLILHPSLSHLTSVCTHCLRPGSPRACSRCHAAYYCDAACQKAAWTAVHSKECQPLRQRKLGSRTGADLPTPVRALVQTLLKQEIEDGVSLLDGHVDKRRNSKSWPDLEMMGMAACAFAGRDGGEADVRRAVELLCKVCWYSRL